VLACATLSIMFGMYNVHKIFQIKLVDSDGTNEEELELAQNDSQKNQEGKVESKMIEISELI
jgi:hypothetical protein